MKIEGKFLVDNRTKKDAAYPYRKLNTVMDYDGESAILVDFLDPDFAMVMKRIDLIITKKGSPLSHLSILAREYKKSIFLTDADISEDGTITFAGDTKAEIKG
ncbi:MAG: PEP-utilizing enzyme [Nanoarchaeota archaeon]